MVRFLFDTNAVGDCIWGRRTIDRKISDARRQGHIVGTTPAVIAELLAGIESSVSRERNMLCFERGRSLFRLWPFTLEAAREYGRVFAELRRRGRPMQVVDMMIAATAMTLPNCVVVTCDSDLFAVPGLRVENWAE